MPEVPSCNSKAGRTDGIERSGLFRTPSIGVQGTSSSEMNVGDISVIPLFFLSIDSFSVQQKRWESTCRESVTSVCLSHKVDRKAEARICVRRIGNEKAPLLGEHALSPGWVRVSLPRRSETAWVCCSALAGKKLAYVGAEGGADVAEGGVEAGGKSLHAGGGAKSNQCNNQGVFDQILTFLAACQILELHIQLEKHGVHSYLHYLVASKVWIPLLGEHALSPFVLYVALRRRSE